MAAEDNKRGMPHNIIMENREHLTISGVSDIDSFDENTVILFTDLGELEIRGNDLHMNKLNVDSGEVNIDGEIYAIIYGENTKSGGGFFSKLFK